MRLEVVGPIREHRTIAVGGRIRAFAAIVKKLGPGRWRKMAGLAWVRLDDGSVRLAEVHWYEATGVGRHHLKIKRYLDP